MNAKKAKKKTARKKAAAKKSRAKHSAVKKAAAKKSAAKKAGGRAREIGQHIGYRYDVNLTPDMSKCTPFLKRYMDVMGWDDLNWLEDVHMGFEAGKPAVFDRNINGWVRVPANLKLPKDQQSRDMIARELLVKFQMSKTHPMVDLMEAYRKF
ncbi:MAG: hypothetical protein MPK11_01650 [Gammaproteobacteria bacterium]|nr:hypothetical protein [Gammaproteobacteria bacterium]